MKDKGNDQMILSSSEKNELGKYTTSYSLPKILPAYPLKYIISPNSIKNLKKQTIKMEFDLFKYKRLTEDNFRSNIKKDLKSVLQEYDTKSIIANAELAGFKSIKTGNTNAFCQGLGTKVNTVTITLTK